MKENTTQQAGPPDTGRLASVRGMVSSTEVGFGIVLVLLVIFILFALIDMRQLNERREEMATQTSQKVEHYYNLRITARNRILSLHRLLASQDPFDRDDEWMEHQALASSFIRSREALEQLALDPRERELLDELMQATRRSQPLQQRVIDLARAGNDTEAHRMLVRAQAAQDYVLPVMDRILDYQKFQIARGTEAATDEYHRAVTLITALGVFGGVVVVLAAFFVRRAVAHQAQLLCDKNAELEANNQELELLGQKAELASRMKSEFLANMSHEIRTPLTAISGSLGLLRGGVLGALGKPVDDMINVACRNTERLLGLLNDILDYSRIEAGKMTVNTEDFRLESELAAVVELFALPAQDKGIKLGYQGSDLALCCRADPHRVRQILINLVGNAIKFTRNGEVVLSVSADQAEPQAHWRVEVRDTGIGVDADIIPTLFASFVQGDGSTSRHYGGAGLGLAICHRLVEAMGGAIGVKSKPGQGSVFWFTLPRGEVADDAGQSAATNHASESAASDASSRAL